MGLDTSAEVPENSTAGSLCRKLVQLELFFEIFHFNLKKFPETDGRCQHSMHVNGKLSEFVVQTAMDVPKTSYDLLGVQKR